MIRSPSILRGFARYAHSSARSYGDAISALNTLQSNAQVFEALMKYGRENSAAILPEVISCMRKARHQPSDFNALNVVHIAGTKGKGSTAAFVASILQQYASGSPIKHVGLYTSPHLRYVRERIQIDDQPVSEEAFASSFFTIWDRVEKAAEVAGEPLPAAKPAYFHFLTLVALHTFLEAGTDATILECGIGGEYDTTNVVPSVVASGISALGIDHVSLLGPNIEEIAWHKAGIMKHGSPAYTVPQPPSALAVLQSRAQEKGVSLEVVDIHPDIASGTVALGLPAKFQHSNASLAVELAAAYLRFRGISVSTSHLPPQFVQGLADAHLSGRCETLREEGLTWRLDGAHTVESLRVAAEWFAQVSPKNGQRVLLFNQQVRAPKPLLKELYGVLSQSLGTPSPFSHVVFCSNVTFSQRGFRPDLVSINESEETVKSLSVQNEMRDIWRELSGSDNINVVPTVEEAVALCRKFSKDKSETEVLVTGSMHLIGSLLEVLE